MGTVILHSTDKDPRFKDYSMPKFTEPESSGAEVQTRYQFYSEASVVTLTRTASPFLQLSIRIHKDQFCSEILESKYFWLKDTPPPLVKCCNLVSNDNFTHL